MEITKFGLLLFLTGILAETSLAQENLPVKSVTVENCLIENVNVDGKSIGEVKVSLKFDVPSKTGGGNLQLTQANGSFLDFEMQCKMMIDESYLVVGRFNEFIICDTIKPVVKNLTYGIPIWVDEKQMPRVEAYTVFSDGQGFSGLVFNNCKRTQFTR